jgi:predicted metal-dependent peptidase
MHDDIDLFVYFTDGYGDYPDWKPRYPVIWVVTTKIDKLKESNNYPPFGRVIEL